MPWLHRNLTASLRQGQAMAERLPPAVLRGIKTWRHFVLKHWGLQWWPWTDRTQTAAVHAVLRPGQTAVDVGANIGYYTLLFARLVGATGRVFAFEPDPINFSLLRRNVSRRRLANVTLANAAVGSRSGRGQLFQSLAHPGDHRIFNSHDGRTSIACDVTTLDEYFAHHDRPIHLVKIDVQGAEGMALEGMHRLLNDPVRSGDLTLLVEYWPSGLRLGGSSPAGFLETLHRLGYALAEIDERRGGVFATTVAQLQKNFPPVSDRYTNLLCRRTVLPTD